MAAIARVSHGTRPVTTVNAAQTRKAPTAVRKPPAIGPAPASRAAPGVDHAMAMGIR
jgi:hypothetical protein